MPEISIFPIKTVIFLAIITFIVSVTSTYIIRRQEILDVPNNRSTHKTPRPTLGGMGIILGFWSGGLYLLFGVPGVMRNGEWIGLGLMSLITIVVCFDDIVRPLKVWEKIILQSCSAVLLIYWGGCFDSITLPFIGEFELSSYLRHIITAVWLIAMCNVINFMDGIDGIVAIHAICICFIVLLWNIPNDVGVSYVVLSLMCSILGFLLFNFPTASIFMGDVGSFFIGMFLGFLGIHGEGREIPLGIYLLPLSFLLYDVIYTLVKRLLKCENVITPHKKHLYQRLSSIGWSDFRICMVTLSVTIMGGWAGYLLLSNQFGWGIFFILLIGAVLVLGTVWIERNSNY